MSPAPTGSATVDPQAQKLLTQMTRLDGDLGRIEKQVLAWARAPLSHTAPLEDLEGRMQSHKVGERGRPGEEVALPRGCENSGTCGSSPRTHSG